MPKLTDEQLAQALSKRPPAPPVPRPSSEEYDPLLDEKVEYFLNPANRPVNLHDESGAWPPNAGAGAWAVRFRYIRVLGGSDDSLADLPLLLSCSRNTKSRIVKHHALRSIVGLTVPPDFRAKVSGSLLAECIDAINADMELAGNSCMENGSVSAGAKLDRMTPRDRRDTAE
jgi:hypothetical protein